MIYPEELKDATITTEISEESPRTGHVRFCRVKHFPKDSAAPVIQRYERPRVSLAIIAEMRHVERQILNDSCVLYGYAVCLAQDLHYCSR